MDPEVSEFIGPSFIEIRDNIILEITKFRRAFSTDVLKERLRQEGYEKICLECGAPLSGRRTSWCCDDHGRDFWRRYDWGSIRNRILTENHDTCQECGITYGTGTPIAFEVHHLAPVAQGGCYFDHDNLIVLCRDCHLNYHTRLRILAHPRPRSTDRRLSEWGSESC